MRLVFWVVLLSVVPLSVDARSEGWVITARDTTADYFAVAMANGEIGVAVGREPFALGSVILGGSYEPGFGDDVSRILEGINPLGLTMAVDGHRRSVHSISRSICGVQCTRPVFQRTV
jgi:hypothetical protein